MTTTTTHTAVLPLEADVLTAFWAVCRHDDADRLELVRQLSTVTVRTAPDWSPKRVRAEFKERPYPAAGCFTCYRRDRRLAWHHLVTIDHGGSNGIWNLVALCHTCHRRIHPWLEQEPDDGGWWMSTESLVKNLLTPGAFKQAPRTQVYNDDEDDRGDEDDE